MTEQVHRIPFHGRYRLIKLLLLFMSVVVVFRVCSLHVIDRNFLQNEGDKRAVRHEVLPAHRGVIFDRNHRPLAISTKVISLWANPKELRKDESQHKQLAHALGMSYPEFKKKLVRYADKEFVYLKRKLSPEIAEKVIALKVPGVYGMHEYQRFYPSGELTSHLIGFTGIDDHGQEGLELAFDQWLDGSDGLRRIIKSRKGELLKSAEIVKAAKSGKDLSLSIDLRMQYLAYKELLRAVEKYQAKSGSLVMLDVKTGEVLAMVNQPAYNPNNRENLLPDNIRNRSVVDAFEPGSVIKPFTVVAALTSGEYQKDTLIDTSPGYMKIGKDRVTDTRNYGVLDVTGLVRKSSNVGMSKMILSIGADHMISTLQKFGFGRQTGVIFPGEVDGFLPARLKWQPIETATLSFGYGITVNTLQLAQAYMVLASGGIMRQVTLLKQDPATASEGVKVIDSAVAKDVINMMKTVVAPGGTGYRAKVPGYFVAGKTGTVKKADTGGYSENEYVGLFAGIAPADNPRLAMVVVIDSPAGHNYYGGLVAAPVFAKVAGGSLRIMGVRPQTEEGRSMLADGNDLLK